MKPHAALALPGVHQLLSPNEKQMIADATGQPLQLIDLKPDQSLDEIDGAGVESLMSHTAPTNAQAWPHLKLVLLVSAGYEHLPERLHHHWHGAVATASGIHAVPMAQHCTAQVLQLAHGPAARPITSSKQWSQRESTYYQKRLLRDQTAGIVGYGSIGRECARQLSALGMRILAMNRRGTRCPHDGYNPWPNTGDPQGDLPEQWFATNQIEQMLPHVDVLIITAPNNHETIGLIRSEQLRLMKSTASLVIISRGGIVDETDLADALRTQTIAAASVDCFADEPPPETHPLFDCPGATLTPHVSGGYDQYWLNLCTLFATNIARIQNQESVINAISER